MGVNLKALIGKLNNSTRAALEGAAGLSLSRTNYNIEIEHYLSKALESSDNDIAKILHHFGVDLARFQKELSQSLDRQDRGNGRTPSISPGIVKMMTEGWTLGSIELGASKVRTGHTLLALASNEELARQMQFSREFTKVEPEAFKKNFQFIVAGSQEDEISAAADATA